MGRLVSLKDSIINSNSNSNRVLSTLDINNNIIINSNSNNNINSNSNSNNNINNINSSNNNNDNNILQIYHEEKCPFNLKEIENKASKRGVVQQTIKDMNQQLVYDNLVLSDKIGSANFFWSFPSKLIIDKKN